MSSKAYLAKRTRQQGTNAEASDQEQFVDSMRISSKDIRCLASCTRAVVLYRHRNPDIDIHSNILH